VIEVNETLASFLAAIHDRLTELITELLGSTIIGDRPPPTPTTGATTTDAQRTNTLLGNANVMLERIHTTIFDTGNAAASELIKLNATAKLIHTALSKWQDKLFTPAPNPGAEAAANTITKAANTMLGKGASESSSMASMVVDAIMHSTSTLWESLTLISAAVTDAGTMSSRYLSDIHASLVELASVRPDVHIDTVSITGLDRTNALVADTNAALDRINATLNDTLNLAVRQLKALNTTARLIHATVARAEDGLPATTSAESQPPDDSMSGAIVDAIMRATGSLRDALEGVNMTLVEASEVSASYLGGIHDRLVELGQVRPEIYIDTVSILGLDRTNTLLSSANILHSTANVMLERIHLTLFDTLNFAARQLMDLNVTAKSIHTALLRPQDRIFTPAPIPEMLASYGNNNMLEPKPPPPIHTTVVLNGREIANAVAYQDELQGGGMF
jgi:hypothetical protein